MMEEGRLTAENTILKREANFFGSHTGERYPYLGTLTTNVVTLLTSNYPMVVEGLQTVYRQLETPEEISTEEKIETREDEFISWYLKTAIMQGRPMSDDELGKVRKEVETGKYSEQIKMIADASQGCTKQLEEKVGLGHMMLRMPSLGLLGEAAFKEGKTRADIVYNKRKILAYYLSLQAHTQSVYGDEDYQNALLTELILEAPFLENVAGDKEPDESARNRHKAYFDEVIIFTGSFKPAKRMEVFEEYTKEYEVPWAKERMPREIADFDKSYLLTLAEFAKTMKRGAWEIDDLYSLLRQTILTRGKIFNAKASQRNIDISPITLAPVAFDDIGGYKEQKEFYLSLLRKTAESHSVLDTLNIILAIGKPGMGKSLGVDAFLSNLPQNARGIKIKYDRSLTDEGHMPEYGAMIRLAKSHPSLQIYAVLEDIDAIAGDRLKSPMTSTFLEIDSAAEENKAPNLHFIATTNRPDVIDPAVIRPGRTTKILMYEEPNKAEERREIVEIQGRVRGLNLSEHAISQIAEKSEGLTPDEIGGIIWTFKFNENDSPSEDAIEKAIRETKLRQKLENKVKKASKKRQD